VVDLNALAILRYIYGAAAPRPTVMRVVEKKKPEPLEPERPTDDEPEPALDSLDPEKALVLLDREVGNMRDERFAYDLDRNARIDAKRAAIVDLLECIEISLATMKLEEGEHE
jgi:23S rRNA pseudoU1915 N3-methylase RlmH